MQTWNQRSSKRVVVHTLLLLALAFIVLNYSPLGSSEQADKYSQDLFNHYLADWIYPADHQQDTLVLLLTDEVIDEYQQGQWPAHYDFHGRVLNRLLLHKPRAVFIDFHWMNLDKPGISYLKLVLERYRNQRIPVYIAARSKGLFFQHWPELLGLVIPVSARLEFDTADFISRAYRPMFDDLPSAAFKIATDLNPEHFTVPHTRTMDIFWATRTNPLNERWMNVEKIEPSLSDNLLQGFTGINTQTPYNTTLLVRDLLNQVSTSEAKARAEADQLLQGKVVMYGASLSGVQDLVFTPNRDILPGVYLHAMALDNLLTWGSKYKSGTASPVPLVEVVPKWLLDLIALFPVALLAALHHNGLINWRSVPLLRTLPPDSKLTVFTLRLLAIFCLGCWLLLCACIEFVWLNLSAASWLGYVEVISYAFLIEKLDLIDCLEQFINDRKEGRQ